MFLLSEWFWELSSPRNGSTFYFVTRLEEAEEKYRSRQSRPEDLEFIEQLKRALAEKELDMKKLVVGADLYIILVRTFPLVQSLTCKYFMQFSKAKVISSKK